MSNDDEIASLQSNKSNFEIEESNDNKKISMQSIITLEQKLSKKWID